MRYEIGRRIEMIPEHPLEHAQLWLLEAEDNKDNQPIYAKVCREVAKKIFIDFYKSRLSNT